MNQAFIWDLRDKAELLTFLVTSQLVEKKRVGTWLEADAVVALERDWLDSRNKEVPLLERVSIASWSAPLASRLEDILPAVSKSTCRALTARGSRGLDFRIPLVRSVYLHSFNHLGKNGWFLSGQLRTLAGPGEI
jgi:hypothetical protein